MYELPQPDSASQNALLRAVADQMALKPRSSAFPPALEALYQNHLGAQDRMRIIIPALLSLAIIDAILLMGSMRAPAAKFTGTIWELAVFTVPILLVMAWLHRDRASPWRVPSTIGCVLLMTLAANLAVRRADVAGAESIAFSLSLIVVAPNILLGLGFRAAVLTSALTCLVSVICLFSDPQLHWHQCFMPISLMAAAGTLTLIANQRMERGSRQIYLLLLREKLQSRSMRAQNDRLNEISYTDPLTGIANRRRFDEMLEVGWTAARHSQESLALLMIDIDHFKRYNDTYGHPAGDQCLQRIARAIAGTVIGESDLAARLGGEEFGILLRNADQHSARAIASRVHQAIERLAIRHSASTTEPFISVSIGLAVAVPAEAGLPATLIDAADRALYDAKHAGRNRTASGPRRAA